MAIPYHPEGKGCVKFFNQTLLNFLKKSYPVKIWTGLTIFRLLIFAYNIIKHALIVYSPFELLHNYKVTLNLSFILLLSHHPLPVINNTLRV